MKKLVLICLMLCLFCCGCSNKPEEVVIRFSTWGSASEMTALKNVVSGFERDNPGVKIELLHIPQDYFQKLHLLFASGMEPDVLLINNQNIPVYSKFLSPLNGFIERDIYFEKSLDSVSVNGAVLAIPRDCSGLVVYYNKDIFRKKHVPYPDESWSIEDLLNISGKLTDSKTFGISFEPLVYYAQPFMHYFGGGVFDENGVAGESPESKQGVLFYKDLAYKYHYAPTPSEVGSKTLAQMFLEGKLAMHISGRWLVPKYRSCAGFDWDVVNFPNYAAYNDSTGWAVSKRTKHKDSALKFVQYLSSRESIENLTQSGLIVPARKDVAYSQVFLNGNPRHSRLFLKSVETAPATRVSKCYNKEVEALNDKYFKVGK